MSKGRDEGYSHVLKYTGIFGGVQGLNILIGLVRNKCVAVLLGPAGMGLVSLFQTTVNFVSQATNLGISFSAVRTISESYDKGDDEQLAHSVHVIRSWSFLTGLVGMLICMALGPLLDSATFSWGNHTLHFILLSPLVAMMAITGGEMAILKGTRQLKSLAVIMLYNVLTALVISVPVYYFFNQKGIVPVMLMMGAVAMFLTLQRSYAMFPLRLKGFKCIRYEGLDMIRLGVAFTLAGILGSGAEFAIRSYLNYFADLDVVGLYNAGFVMTMTYGGLIFSAMETDYFPRLSAANNDVVKYNDLINKQAEVSLLLIAPLLVAALFWLPVALPLLTSVKFLPVVDMMRFMALSLYFRAVNLPIEYLSLARGASLSYLFLESVYDILMVALVIVGYHVWGLTGTGFAILATTLCNTALVLIYMGIRFHVRLRWALVRMQIVQVAIGLLAFCCCLQLDGWEYWLSGVALFLLSLFVSVHLLQQKSHLWEKLKLKFIGRFR